MSRKQLKIFYYYYLRGKQTESSHFLVHFLSACNNWDWVRAEARSQEHNLRLPWGWQGSAPWAITANSQDLSLQGAGIGSSVKTQAHIYQYGSPMSQMANSLLDQTLIPTKKNPPRWDSLKVDCGKITKTLGKEILVSRNSIGTQIIIFSLVKRSLKCVQCCYSEKENKEQSTFIICYLTKAFNMWEIFFFLLVLFPHKKMLAAAYILKSILVKLQN